MGQNVSVGAYTIIEDGVTIGDGTSIGNHNTICRGTTIGANCTIFHNTSLGEAPQDLKYGGEETLTFIDNVLLMACAHVAHDCTVGDNTIMANLATLGGHVELGEWVNLGGAVMVHQFTKIGSHSFIGGGFRAVQDVPPFIIAAGEPIRFGGINKIGLERRGFSDEDRAEIKKAYRTYFLSKLTRTDALKKIKSEMSGSDHINTIVDFIESSERGII